jgi:UDP-2-acetamido-3-amino-2,3-dideoxy-glucuronate N-acetyltransferase
MNAAPEIHPSSIVDENAIIGDGTRIWHFCHIRKAEIGRNCVIGQNCFIDNEVSIGNGVKVQNNVSIYNGVALEDDVFIGPSAVFTNVINPRSFIERKHEFRKTVVRKGATIGANATIVCGVEIGCYAMVGAGAVITRSVPPFSLIIGNPGRPSGWISKAGGKLDFDGEGRAKCPIKDEYYILRDGQVSVENSY